MYEFMIIEYVIIFLSTFILTYFLVPANIKFSNTNGIIDKPSQRSLHSKLIPSAGGLSFAIPIILFQIMYYLFKGNNILFLNLSIANILIMLLGFLDDKKKFTARYKLFFQIGIVIFLYISGFRVELLSNPFGQAFNLGILSFPVTIIWFLLVINAFNLIDGLDGLAAGIALIVALVLFAVGIQFRNFTVSFLAFTMIGSLAAFLKYNFYPAKIFMGDTGSLFIGLNIAAIAATGTAQYKGITTMTLLIPIIALAIPLSDTFFTIFRRIKNNKHIFEADKKHLHHKVYDLGFSQKTIAWISYFITFLFGLISFGFSFASQRIFMGILFILFIIILIFFILHKEMYK